MNPSLARWIIRNYGFERTKILRNKLKRLLSRFLDQQQDIEVVRGLKLHLDLRFDRQNFVFWMHEGEEPELQWVIRNLLPVGGTMVDCGANFGLFGMLAMHQRAARTHFIEPHPRLAAAIRRHLALNSYGVLGKVHEIAVSNAPGESTLYLNPGRNDGTHSLACMPGNTQTVAIHRERLEDLLRREGIASVELLKIDAEGHDFEVMEGLGEFLRPQQVGVVFVEMNDRKQECWDLLAGRGYLPYASRRIDIDALRREYRRGNLSPFFTPARAPDSNNYLWVGKDTPNARFMSQVVEF